MRSPKLRSKQKKRARCSGLWEREEKEYVYVRYGQLSAPGGARKCGVITPGVGVNKLVCAFVSREKY